MNNIKIDQMVQAATLGALNVSRETFDKVEAFITILLQWNLQINLISRSTESDIWHRHVCDSIQLNQYISDSTRTLIDLGTGAGFPGMVLALIRQDLQCSLVEANSKKASFLHFVKQTLKLKNVTVFNQRIEEINQSHYDIITSRALAPLDQLLRYGYSLGQKNTLYLFPKGSKLDEELEKARENWCFELNIEKSELAQDSHILLIRNLVTRMI